MHWPSRLRTFVSGSSGSNAATRTANQSVQARMLRRTPRSVPLLKNGDAVPWLDEEIAGLLIADTRAFLSSPEVPSRWTFSSTPFRADLELHYADSMSYGSDDMRMTLRLTQTPH